MSGMGHSLPAVIALRFGYESSNAIYISTMLKGPERSETVLEVETYPYVVVKVLYQDKDVIFQ